MENYVPGAFVFPQHDVQTLSHSCLSLSLLLVAEHEYDTQFM